MESMLIYIGENEFFDADSTINTIMSMPGVSNPIRRLYLGTAFDCDYTFEDRTTRVYLFDTLQTVKVRRFGIESYEFAVRFQQRMPMPLHAIDSGYTFDVILTKFKSGEEFRSEIEG
jgi:hypothetical protein